MMKISTEYNLIVYLIILNYGYAVMHGLKFRVIHDYQD